MQSTPASLVSLATSPLEPFDLLGRNKIVAEGLTDADSESAVRRVAASAFAKIERNNFKFKSLSCWSFNIAVGCQHGCRFCYVPASQHTQPGKEKENTGPLATSLREFGVHDPDAEWGRYVLFRPWDEAMFLASLKAAENTPLEDLNPDGNRAVILCSTTDPYQTVTVEGNPVKTKLLNGHRRFLVRRALELILKHSTINVRILTRSPLAVEDFDLYQKFGDRLLFGMSLPTLQDPLLKVYEPRAPGPQTRLRTLQKAATAGIPLFVAVAPTYPECDEEDLRATLVAIRPLKPLTVFQEPINIRAENVQRIAAHAASLDPPVRLHTEVFDSGPLWRRYAVEQLMAMQKVARELGVEKHLHLWPDKSLKAKGPFLQARKEIFREARSAYRETVHEKQERDRGDDAAYKEFAAWLSVWHGRISEWPRPTTKKQ